MSNLSMMEAKLPPGFRFHPREEELICDYLAKKASGALDDGNGSCSLIIDVDLNKCEPWDLPDMACVGGKEWYFFNLRDRKYSTGRMNRATQSGYWKATGKDRQVSRRGVLVGMRKTLVFYQGRAPNGKKTDWVMHEFRMEGTTQLTNFSFKEGWVLCRVFYKSSSGGGNQASKLTMEPPCHHDVGSSSSLPPLMDTFMALDQAHQSLCFSSNLPQNLTLPSKAAGAEFPAQLKNTQSSFLGAALQDHLGHGEKKVVLLKAVLDDFTKLEASPQGEVLPCVPQEKLESYFADHGIVPQMWNVF